VLQGRVDDSHALGLVGVLQGRVPTADDTHALGLVEAVVLEALRLYPPAYLVGRCANRDLEVGAHHLPKVRETPGAQALVLDSLFWE
jgi:cytochrome P450